MPRFVRILLALALSAALFSGASKSAHARFSCIPEEIDLLLGARQPEFLPPRLPAERGMRAADDLHFRETARENNDIIMVIDSNPNNQRYIGKAGYLPKPGVLKACKSRISGPNVGLVACDPTTFGSLKQWRRVTEKLSSKGFKIAGADQGFVVSRPIPDAQSVFGYYSDYDLLGVYTPDGHENYTDGLVQKLNQEFGVPMIQHGPLSLYGLKHEVGLKFPVTTYLPDGSSVQILNRNELRLFYSEHGMSWNW